MWGGVGGGGGGGGVGGGGGRALFLVGRKCSDMFRKFQATSACSACWSKICTTRRPGLVSLYPRRANSPLTAFIFLKVTPVKNHPHVRTADRTSRPARTRLKLMPHFCKERHSWRP